jgi:hypothetical protein
MTADVVCLTVIGHDRSRIVAGKQEIGGTDVIPRRHLGSWVPGETVTYERVIDGRTYTWRGVQPVPVEGGLVALDLPLQPA